MKIMLHQMYDFYLSWKASFEIMDFAHDRTLSLAVNEPCEKTFKIVLDEIQ